MRRRTVLSGRVLDASGLLPWGTELETCVCAHWGSGHNCKREELLEKPPNLGSTLVIGFLKNTFSGDTLCILIFFFPAFVSHVSISCEVY